MLVSHSSDAQRSQYSFHARFFSGVGCMAPALKRCLRWICAWDKGCFSMAGASSGQLECGPSFTRSKTCTTDIYLQNECARAARAVIGVL